MRGRPGLGAVTSALIALLFSVGGAEIADARDRSMDFSIRGPWSKYESKTLAYCIKHHESEPDWAACENAETTKFEVRMNHVYRGLLASLPREKADELRKSQRTWLSWRVRRCNEMPSFDENNQVTFRLKLSECFLFLAEKRWYKLKTMAHQ